MKQSNNKNLTVLIAISLLVLLGVGIYLFVNSGQKWKWYHNYKSNSEHPFGTSIIRNIIKEAAGVRFVEMQDSFPLEFPTDTVRGVSNYLYLGQTLYIDSTETQRLLKFLEAGNKVFLFTESVSNLLTDSLLKQGITEDEPEEYNEFEMYEDDNDFEQINPDEPGDETIYYPPFSKSEVTFQVIDSVVELSLSGSTEKLIPLALADRYDGKIIREYWTSFVDHLESYSGQKAEVLGTFNKKYPNLVMVKQGAGYLYIHSTPLIFTNYYMLNDTAMNYNRSILSNMGSGKIFWDESNREYDYKAQPNDAGIPNEGPLEFILSEPSMRKGWYLLLAGGILYLSFGARRHQRIIPATENMENTSIEYAEVISQLFMKQSDHRQLIVLKMDLFKLFLRERLGIRVPHQPAEINEKLYDTIAQQSGINAALIQSVFDQYKYFMVAESVDTPSMLDFHNKLEEFYFHSR
ncbi:MAG: DUF4350 domain-containing protein [Crocinitomicaceae bacterium]|nr:DUF4350 domain-containing protein [Crocinitomicaceae bacterium]